MEEEKEEFISINANNSFHNLSYSNSSMTDNHKINEVRHEECIVDKEQIRERRKYSNEKNDSADKSNGRIIEAKKEDEIGNILNKATESESKITSKTITDNESFQRKNDVLISISIELENGSEVILPIFKDQTPEEITELFCTQHFLQENIKERLKNTIKEKLKKFYSESNKCKNCQEICTRMPQKLSTEVRGKTNSEENSNFYLRSQMIPHQLIEKNISKAKDNDSFQVEQISTQNGIKSEKSKGQEDFTKKTFDNSYEKSLSQTIMKKNSKCIFLSKNSFQKNMNNTKLIKKTLSTTEIFGYFKLDKNHDIRYLNSKEYALKEGSSVNLNPMNNNKCILKSE